MDIIKELKQFAEEFFLLISGKPWKLRTALESVLRIFNQKQHRLHPKLMEEFPSLRFLNFLSSLLQDLHLLLPPLGDQVDSNASEFQISFPKSNVYNLEELLIEASSNAEMVKQLYKCVESFAIQLPGIGIGQLLVSSPLSRIYRQSLMSISGTTAIPSSQCAAAESSNNTELRQDLPFSQLENLSGASDLCEESQPRMKKRKQDNSTQICSGI
jgi:hypothetical protein